MGYFEDYLFWSMIRQFSAEYGYRIITLTDNQQEVWLENTDNRQHPVVRFMRYDLDWANWLKRDIDRTLLNGEQIRKKLYRKPINVLNIYVSAFAPVDDYSFISEPAVQNKTEVNSFILETDRLDEGIDRLSGLFGERIEAPQDREIEEGEVQAVKQAALSESVKKAQAEKQLFQQAKPFFTYILAALQVLVFIIMEIAGNTTQTKTLIEFGAKYGPLILQGEWWRFIAPMFIHIGIMHLAMNTLSLYFIGGEVERIFGRSRFLFLYLFAGFTGTAASFVFSPSVSAGASGAIFGCFGALLYFGLVHPKLFMRTMGMNVVILLVLNLGYGFSSGVVDNSGHIGGLIGGFLAAGIIHLPKSRMPVRQAAFTVAAAVSTWVLLQYGFSHPAASENSDQVMAALAYEEYDNGSKEKAKDMLERFTADYDSAPVSYYYLGEFAIQESNWKKAEAYDLKAIKQKTDFDEAHYRLALVYYQQNKIEEARKQAEKAVDLKPDDNDYQGLLEELKGL